MIVGGCSRPSGPKHAGRHLASRNFRIFFIGQAVSVTGYWLRLVAQSWLVIELGGNGTELGIVTITQFLPVLLIGPWAGVIVDRRDPHRLVQTTQGLAAVPVVVLGILTVSGSITLPVVYVLAAISGAVQAFDLPGRQALVYELVGPEAVTRAIGLNSVVVNAARVLGPAIAGMLIATVGTGPCFLLNATTFGLMPAGLAFVRRSELEHTPRAVRGPHQVRAGLAYVRRLAEVRVPLELVAIVSVFAYEFAVSLPLLADETFGSGVSAYGAMTSSMGLGAVVGGLAAARWGLPTQRRLTLSATAFGVLVTAIGLAPTLGVVMVVLALTGAAWVTFLATTTSVLQLAADDEQRGRVMALFGVAILGSRPIGGPVVGSLADAFGPRAPLLVGGLATLLATARAHRRLSATGGLARTARRTGLHPAGSEPISEVLDDRS